MKASEIKLDPDNRNLGSETGKALIKESIDRFGFVRPVAVDRDMRPIAGNHIIAEAIARNADIIVVPTHGHQLVINVRDDLDLGNPETRAASYADNEVQKKNYTPDLPRLVLDATMPNISPFFHPAEIAEMRATVLESQGKTVEKDEEWEKISIAVGEETFATWTGMLERMPGDKRVDKFRSWIEELEGA